eukprot:CAMPEP_0194217802 /NCGR_PEP_ID=MMETSP0156-20130528/22281_1 /TAXON_ID=33649 /ORGANISM="Thalassionema nitzschioides, Strain L26-B" /LENGTH=294 /DNA_ID=CAMNT_0038946939 /DNA_START=112 /DNA_END=993 /DNA_ORIENTATION=-
MSQAIVGDLKCKIIIEHSGNNDDSSEDNEKTRKRQKVYPSAVIDLVSPRPCSNEVISLLDNEVDSKPRAQPKDKKFLLKSARSHTDVISLVDDSGDDDGKIASKSSSRTSNLSSSSSFSFDESLEKSWTHEEKAKIYEDARRPEKLLRKQLAHLYEQRKSIKQCSDEWEICEEEIRKTERDLALTEESAARDIYNRNNIAGGMGKVHDMNNGKLVVDFHGLRVKEAIDKFEEMIIPVLPVQKEVYVVTGRGKHSKTGKSVLKLGLIDHIREKYKNGQGSIKWENHPSNPGMIIF